jgi:ribonuclease BN (tRNA processing enzyme)
MNRVVLLGVKGGPSIRAKGAMPTSSLLDLDGQLIVVDCGLGVTRGLVEAGVDLKALQTIVVTHLHSDHILELGGLVHTAWVTGLRTNIHIYGPPGLHAYWQGFLAAMAYDIHLRVVDDGRQPLTELVTVTEISEGSFTIGSLAVRTLRVQHPPVDVALSYRFEGSKTVTFSGDTTYFPPLAEFAQRSDLLVHEAMLPEGIEAILQKTGGGEKLRAHLNASHTVVDDVAKIARDAGVGKLVLNHLVPVDDARFNHADWLARIAAVWDGPALVGQDGLEIVL